jgi:hypothetical protein
MKYFCRSDERKGTCYYEFQKGGFNEEFWLHDSLLIHDDIWFESGLEDFFSETVAELEDIGIAQIDRSEWERIVQEAEGYDETIKEAIDELAVWAEENFRENDFFTILGL